MSEFSDEFMQGQRDCKEGVAAMISSSDEYYRGYGTQYEAESLLSEMGLMEDREMEMVL